MYTILDCYTDEPAGLGVPPYLGTYPRYIAGKLYPEKVNYITIDDLRLYFYYKEKKKENEIKTNIKIYNTTDKNISEILAKTSVLIVIAGVHTPGKYLSALPGTLAEIIPLIKNLKCKKILTGPAVFGTQLYGGRTIEKQDLSIFDEIIYEDEFLDYEKLKEYAVKGAYIINQIPSLCVIEIETGSGCMFGKCSFCIEPIKSKLQFREQKDIHDEILEFYKLGCRHFRLGKQTCFFSYKLGNENELEKLLQPISKLNLKVLHIDNVNPVMVNEERTKLVVKYCTEGNVAAFGVESFDPEVIKENSLNSNPEIVMKAIEIINKYGAIKGENGMPKFLPGLNLIFGLKGETRKTGEENFTMLKKIIDSNLLLRRINIRQVVPFPGTKMYDVKNKFIKKNKRFYWQWRNKIRQEIDLPMLKRMLPEGSVLKDVRTEIYDGNTTFCRQLGTYPLIVGVKGRLPLNKFINVRVNGHMLRSIIGEEI